MVMGDTFHLYKINRRSAFKGGFRWLYDLCVFCIVRGRRREPLYTMCQVQGVQWRRSASYFTLSVPFGIEG